ncbi:MAG: TlpA family protein disulfide reductase [Dehalococcoidia bacterium]
MNVNNPLVRLVAAGAIVAVAVLALWQAGILFPDDEATVTTPDGTAKIFAATTDVDTPPIAGRSVGLSEGDIAPDFEFSTFDGKRMRLSDLRGQPVFLNFWASWCGPCRQEMPNMQTMLEKYSSSKLVVLAVNNGEAIAPAQRFIDRIEVQLSEFGYDPTAQVVKKYQVTGLPVSYFIDANGVITRVVAGELSFNVMESSVQEVIAGYRAVSN